MALSGLHVACGFAGSIALRSTGFPILGKPSWSQTMPTAATTTQAAPKGDEARGDPIMSVISSVDAFVAVGPSPDATNGPRYFVAANERLEFYVSAGDKLAWVAA
ncbi:hypothetical protein [Mesorhizobium sp. M2A.F.Ca.ET.039.01.1.1]|uniref:hypothetical protein n=1 Tax=Mesorhizobium sp. M2A.F.Ca.ET.039.01.1.1 TaxID=2496746 RepID=UPI000FC9A38E|nr:hypothetical protein [Mesorhizobium sp. M2A.F.Ca.ET.039.01.1.1]RWX72568.1 hypothetical protein EOA24_00830 [Mesorhizobium sp. M2A.F.Ca.ET.039.01.1.1]